MVKIRRKSAFPILLAVFIAIFAVLSLSQRIYAAALFKGVTIDRIEKGILYIGDIGYQCDADMCLYLNGRPITLSGLSLVASEYPLDADILFDDDEMVTEVKAVWNVEEALFSSYTHNIDGTISIWSESNNRHFICRSSLQLITNINDSNDPTAERLNSLIGKYVLFVKGLDDTVRYIYTNT